MYDGEITMDDLEQSLQDFAERNQRVSTSRWTPELDALLIKGREELKLTWPVLESWWKENVGWGTSKTLGVRYSYLKAGSRDGGRRGR